MQIGFTIYPNRPDEMGPLCKHAEDLGFKHVWVGEHIVSPVENASNHPYGGRSRPPVLPSDDRFYDLWIAIAAIAAQTNKIMIGSGIYLLALRHPLSTARACLTAQHLAHGRFLFGVGIGWLAEEFEAMGVPFAERVTRFEEQIHILRNLFAGGEYAHDGQHYKFPRLQMTGPKADIPIMIGGTKGAAVRRAARIADGWYGTTIPLEDSIAIRAEILRVRAEEGHADKPFAFHARVLGAADYDNLVRYQDAGFDSASVIWDVLHPEDPRTTTLDYKLRCLEDGAKRIGINRF